jgi:hypothetical protein
MPLVGWNVYYGAHIVLRIMYIMVNIIYCRVILALRG